MKSTYLPALLLILFTGQHISAQTGREILLEQEKRHISDSEYASAQMTISDSKGREKKRVIHNWSMKNPEGLRRSLIKFSSPTNINNVGVLTWEQEGDADDDQWLSLPATKQVKRITGGSKNNLFMGTDLAYEDMRAQDLDAHQYTILREEPCDGIDCWVIEAIPATELEKKESGYSKRILWIRKDNYLTCKTEFYGRNGTLAKIGTFSDPVQVKSDLWRNRTTRMERLASQTTTTISLVKLSINEAIDESLFTRRGLIRPITGE
jgi:outer membrane lipoprotein-sorting protein